MINVFEILIPPPLKKMSYEWDWFSIADFLQMKENIDMLKLKGVYFYIKCNKFNKSYTSWQTWRLKN